MQISKKGWERNDGWLESALDFLRSHQNNEYDFYDYLLEKPNRKKN